MPYQLLGGDDGQWTTLELPGLTGSSSSVAPVSAASELPGNLLETPVLLLYLALQNQKL